MWACGKETESNQLTKEQDEHRKERNSDMEKICFKTQKGPAAIGPYCTATVYGDTVYMSGVIGVDPAVQKPVEGGTLAQARQVFENIRTVLGELGLTMDDVLTTTVFLTNLGDFAEVNKLYAEYFGPNYPARSCVEVSRLPMSLAIEVECIARCSR